MTLDLSRFDLRRLSWRAVFVMIPCAGGGLFIMACRIAVCSFQFIRAVGKDISGFTVGMLVNITGCMTDGNLKGLRV